MSGLCWRSAKVDSPPFKLLGSLSMYYEHDTHGIQLTNGAGRYNLLSLDILLTKVTPLSLPHPLHSNGCGFLAVRNSSIGDLVPHWLTFTFDIQKEILKTCDHWDILIRVMRRHDLTETDLPNENFPKYKIFPKI